MIVALAQIDLAWEDFNTNINKVETFTKEASLKNVELILFPEMCLSGFTNNISSLEKSEDEIIKTIKNITIRFNLLLLHRQKSEANYFRFRFFILVCLLNLPALVALA